jgi:hypothetical protein
MDLRVRVPGWTAGPPEVVLNGTPLRNAVVPAGSAGGWAVVSRHWRPGDWLTVTLPMSLEFNPAPDNPAVQAVSYGPVVLSGLYGAGYAAAGPAPGTAAAPSTNSPPSTASPASTASPPAGNAAGTHAPGGVPGVTSDGQATPLPVLDTTSVRRTTANPMTFEATADARRITLVPVSRAQHKAYTVYWQTTET